MCRHVGFLILLAIFLLLGGCANMPETTTEVELAPSIPQPGSTITCEIRTSSESDASPIEILDRTDLDSVIAWLANAIQNKQPAQVGDLVGENGVAFVLKWPGGVALPGYNNRALIERQLEKALIDSEPVCYGYVPDYGSLPNKALVLFQGLNMDWDTFGGESFTNSDLVGFSFFQFDQGWDLVHILKVDPAGPLPKFVIQLPCPEK